MHSSVLQNKKYIDFANKNTVEVITIDIQTGISKKDKRAETYTDKDENGNPVERLVEFPNLTVDQLDKLRGSGASKYSSRGVPYTVVVNPHTLEMMEDFLGGRAAGALMDAVTVHRKALTKQYGKGVSRKELAKLDKESAKIKKDLGAGKLANALSGLAKLQKKTAKGPQALQDRIGKVAKEVLDAAGKQLDEAEAMIGRGAAKEASRILSPLARALKGTDLEARAAELLAKSKAE